MPCFTPLKLYRAPGGGVAFDSVKGYVDRPLEVPCGKCVGCRGARARGWALRCVHESQMHERNSFLTLTYRDEDLPASGSVDMRELQLFWKKARKRFGRFRYFACGEYGSQSLRPHYHAICFGLDFDDKVELSGSKASRLWTSKALEDCWGLGHVSIGAVTYASASYVAGYVMKKVLAPDFLVGQLGLEREFVVMSKRPGLGASWLEAYKADVYPHDEVVLDGMVFRPPRYYDKQLSEAELDEYRRSRASRRREVSPERLRVKERCAIARESRKVRDL